MFAGFQREIEQRLALRRAGFGAGENHGVAEHDGAVFMPEVEMADPQPRIHIHQQVGDVLARGAFGDAHVEGGGQVQGFQVVAPGEAEMMVAPLARHGQIQFVPAGAFKGPAIILDGAFQHVDGMGGEVEIVLLDGRHTGEQPLANTKRSSCDPNWHKILWRHKSPRLSLPPCEKDSTALGIRDARLWIP